LKGTVAAPLAQTKLRNAATDAPILNQAMMSRIGASVMGESALIDKETGRIYWEGGSSTVSASMSPVINVVGIRHLKATTLSLLLLISLFSILARHWRRRIEFWAAVGFKQQTWPLAMFYIVATWIVYRIPNFENWFITTLVALYLTEAYTCNTRRYLANAISSPDGVEEYIEYLRQQEPTVTWKVRCFHYKRRWFAAIFLPQIWKKIFRRRNEVDEDEDANLISSLSSPSLTTKKVVTHRAEANYVYNRYDMDGDDALHRDSTRLTWFPTIVVRIVQWLGCGRRQMLRRWGKVRRLQRLF
jgi:hypothetical protein